VKEEREGTERERKEFRISTKTGSQEHGPMGEEGGEQQTHSSVIPNFALNAE